MTIDIEQLTEDLQKQICVVTFDKVNGERRVMRCTLNPHNMPLVEHKSEVTRKRNDDIISVWDVEKNAWRSFRKDKIIDWSKE